MGKRKSERLNGGEYHCLARIIGVDTEPGTRFNYQGAGKPIVEAPDGDPYLLIKCVAVQTVLVTILFI